MLFRLQRLVLDHHVQGHAAAELGAEQNPVARLAVYLGVRLPGGHVLRHLPGADGGEVLGLDLPGVAGFVEGDETFSDENVTGGRRVTRIQEQADPFSEDSSLLDRYLEGDDLESLVGVRTDLLSALPVRRSGLSSPSASDPVLPSAFSVDNVEGFIPSDLTLSPKDRARVELIVSVSLAVV